MCVDTSATGDANEYEVIQPNVFIQKQSSKEIVMQQKPKIRPGPKSSKTGNSQVLIFIDITLINFKRLVKYESLN